MATREDVRKTAHAFCSLVVGLSALSVIGFMLAGLITHEPIWSELFPTSFYVFICSFALVKLLDMSFVKDLIQSANKQPAYQSGTGVPARGAGGLGSCSESAKPGKRNLQERDESARDSGLPKKK
jgi:hypothetical protein